MHPDHVGGAELAAAATGAPVFQGRLDYAQCERVWGSDDWPERIAEWFLRHGVPSDVADELIESGHVFADFVQFAWNPTLVDAGRRDRRLAGPRDARSRRRPSGASARRRSDRGRHAAHTDHAGNRSLSREPARPARRLPRLARSSSPSSALASRTEGTGKRLEIRSRAALRSSNTTRSDSIERRLRSGRYRVPATTSRTISSETSSHRFSGVSPSPRRCLISNGSSRSGGQGASRMTGPSPILPISLVDDLPSSTNAPGVGR